MDYVVKGCVSGMADLVKINETINMVTNSNKIVDYPNSKSHSFANGDILFKDVSFKYDDNSGYVFRNFNLHIKHGEKVGLVGHSGVGKTTLISLLLRFYDINDGVISIDGKNIKTDITQKSLRGNIAYVPQDPVLFHRSIRDNIVYGNLNATEDEIIEACKKAYCLDFIQSMEYGFNTIVGEKGAKLSGGQKQRIIIARTILKNSKILILDEATSAIDNNTEKEIQKAMDNLMENRTVIIITHRSQVLNSVDRIVTLDNKKVIKDEKNNF
jgi:ATP-binding cassette subfamily B protein